MSENETNENKTKQLALFFDDLEPHEQDAIFMRYKGHTYREIALYINRKEYTVRSWFYVGGRLYGYYEIYKSLRAQERAENLVRSDELITEANILAVHTIIDIMNNKNPSSENNDGNRFRAAQEILNRNMGKPLERVDHTSKGKGFNLLTATYEELMDAKRRLQVEDRPD